MLVYKDWDREESLSSVAVGCLRTISAASQDLDGLRTLVIQAGQLEQAVQDLGRSEKAGLKAVVSEIMEEAAAVFEAARTRSAGRSVKNVRETRTRLLRLATKLELVRAAGDHRVTVKIPEGFAFYSLFPEQYCASASEWATARAARLDKRAVVAGVRSIGTTLSAVVAARLKALGWRTTRLTVRPSGPAFRRKVETERPRLNGIRSALVVDEGPGLSGSSIVAVAEWLEEAGVSDISFLPGHQGEPGEAASPEIRRWWSDTPRYFTRLEEIRWNGLSLHQIFASSFCKASDGAKDFRDVGAGLWRNWAFAREKDWPGVSRTFERHKVLCAGEGGRVLWKFSGLCNNADDSLTGFNGDLKRCEELANDGLVPRLLGSRYGFTAMPWVEGERLTARDGQNPRVLEHIGRYILQAARPALSDSEAQLAITRLSKMLYWNVREGLGEELAERAVQTEKAAREVGPGPSYGDGRLAPYEWVRTSSGRILKTDSMGHSSDHTLVGRQSVLWDVSGAVVEWDLEEAQAEPVLRALPITNAKIDPNALTFYQNAYAAFRLGLTSLGIIQAGDDVAERERLERAYERYKQKLKALLSQAPN